MKSWQIVLVLYPFLIFAQQQQIYSKAAVSSARIEASEIGAEILKQGGNAFDAMIAVELALAVSYPYAGNIGGGGFMVYAQANGSVGSLDYRELAPEKASENMYLTANGSVNTDKSTKGALAVGVPGTIAGIFEVHKKFGSLPIETLFKPAIRLARKGVRMSALQYQQWRTHQKTIIEVSGKELPFKIEHKIGDRVTFRALARTLERISKNGSAEFYSGKTARKLVSALRKRGGIITANDLKNYRAKWRKPLCFPFKEYTICSMPPPSSGGVALAQLFGMLENFKLDTLRVNNLTYIQLLTELERRAYADRSKFLGDPDFVNVPVAELTASNYLKDRAANINFDRATASKDIEAGAITISESDETTHYSIADSFGNVVAVTTTLNGAFGSKLYLPELGFFLNNEMDDFSAKPGFPNSYGLTGSSANKIEPGKRMLSSMTPTIVLKNNKPILALGSPGGSTIITTVFQTLLNVLQFKMPIQTAIDSPRFHHQWLPDEVLFERNFPKEHFQALENKGYKIKVGESPVIGKVDAIFIDSLGNKHAGADKRGEDATAGF
ncbi:gamma-glutamyltransferase [Flavobacterium sp.]|uniref:gamma-glutamyltransferase n=1 Tax=Flavobacterium sp. TaxID=239 RepID=UPI003B9D5A63